MRRTYLIGIISLLQVTEGQAQDSTLRRLNGDSVLIRFVDADIRAVLRGLSPYLRKPLLTADLQPTRLSLETPRPIPAVDVVHLLRGMVEARGLQWLEDSAFYRVVPAPASPPPTAAASSDSPVQLYVLSLRHARATEVAGTVNLLFGVGSPESAARRGISTPTLADELRRTGVPNVNDPSSKETQQNAGGQAATLRGQVSLVPDERTNSLLVRASEQDAAVIRQAVQQLDVRPLQVLIEVLIVELRKNRSFELAVSGEGKTENGATNLAGELVSSNPGGLVLRFMRMTRSEVDLKLNAAVARGDATLVSRPVLIASNNSEARFLVGSQRPFVQVSRTLPTDSPVRDQVIQYRDVGTKLSVRPSINQDGYVALFLQQEISSATDETQFGAPVISTREASTEVLVRDGQTIVIGGLTDSSRTRSSAGIPLLSAIPGIGGLFGESRRRMEATEVFLFLTPHVIRSDADADSLTTPRLPGRRATPDSLRRP